MAGRSQADGARFTFRGSRCFLGGTGAKRNWHRSLRSRASQAHLLTVLQLGSAAGTPPPRLRSGLQQGQVWGWWVPGGARHPQPPALPHLCRRHPGMGTAGPCLDHRTVPESCHERREGSQGSRRRRGCRVSLADVFRRSNFFFGLRFGWWGLCRASSCGMQESSERCTVRRPGVQVIFGAQRGENNLLLLSALQLGLVAGTPPPPPRDRIAAQVRHGWGLRVAGGGSRAHGAVGARSTSARRLGTGAPVPRCLLTNASCGACSGGPWKPAGATGRDRRVQGPPSSVPPLECTRTRRGRTCVVRSRSSSWTRGGAMVPMRGGEGATHVGGSDARPAPADATAPFDARCRPRHGEALPRRQSVPGASHRSHGRAPLPPTGSRRPQIRAFQHGWSSRAKKLSSARPPGAPCLPAPEPVAAMASDAALTHALSPAWAARAPMPAIDRTWPGCPSTQRHVPVRASGGARTPDGLTCGSTVGQGAARDPPTPPPPPLPPRSVPRLRPRPVPNPRPHCHCRDAVTPPRLLPRARTRLAKVRGVRACLPARWRSGAACARTDGARHGGRAHGRTRERMHCARGTASAQSRERQCAMLQPASVELRSWADAGAPGRQRPNVEPRCGCSPPLPARAGAAARAPPRAHTLAPHAHARGVAGVRRGSSVVRPTAQHDRRPTVDD